MTVIALLYNLAMPYIKSPFTSYRCEIDRVRSYQDVGYDPMVCMISNKVIYSEGMLSVESTQRIEAEGRIYASVILSIIGSDNGLSPVRRQAII